MSVYIENKLHNNIAGVLPSFHLKGITTSIEKTFHKISFWIERSKQRSELAALNDRMLEDIGYTRAQAQMESSKPFWR